MTMHERTKQLDDLMRDHDLTARDVGEMLDRTPHTVRVWRSKYDARVIPPHALEVLRLKLAARA